MPAQSTQQKPSRQVRARQDAGLHGVKFNPATGIYSAHFKVVMKQGTRCASVSGFDNAEEAARFHDEWARKYPAVNPALNYPDTKHA